MKALMVREYGGPAVLRYEDVSISPPGSGQALVRIKAIGVNFIDIYERRGEEPVELPFIPGLEASGIVESVGQDVEVVQPGDRVAYTGQYGAYAEASLVQADRLVPLPDSLSFEHGASFPSQGMTAHYLLHEYRQLKAREVVLIHAAAGGMGLILVQWAKHLGCVVIGTVSTEEKSKIAYEFGADHVIIYTQQDFVAETKHFTNGHGADLIIDGVSKTTFLKDLEAAAFLGHIVVYGEASGLPDPVSPYELQKKSLTVSSGLLSHHTRTRDTLLKRANAVLEGIKAGWLRLRTEHVYSLASASEAHRLLEGRRSTGKIILKP